MYHGYVLKIFNGNKTKTEMMKLLILYLDYKMSEGFTYEIALKTILYTESCWLPVF